MSDLLQVCITGLFFNDNQITVGKEDDQESFWMQTDHTRCDENHMTRFIHVYYLIFLRKSYLFDISKVDYNKIQHT